jgi:hypothetical protein
MIRTLETRAWKKFSRQQPLQRPRRCLMRSDFEPLVRFAAVQLSPAAWRHAFPVSEDAIEGTRILVTQQARHLVDLGQGVRQKLPPHSQALSFSV